MASTTGLPKSVLRAPARITGNPSAGVSVWRTTLPVNFDERTPTHRSNPSKSPPTSDNVVIDLRDHIAISNWPHTRRLPLFVSQFTPPTQPVYELKFVNQEQRTVAPPG